MSLAAHFFDQLTALGQFQLLELILYHHLKMFFGVLFSSLRLRAYAADFFEDNRNIHTTETNIHASCYNTKFHFGYLRLTKLAVVRFARQVRFKQLFPTVLYNFICLIFYVLSF